MMDENQMAGRTETSHNVLIVEDDTALRKQVCFAVEKYYTVYEAQNRKEAIRILKNADISVAILDLGLPPASNAPDEGLKIIDYIMENSETKILVLTGQDSEDVTAASIRRGVFDYIPKPVNMEKVIYAIERAVLFRESEQRIGEEGVKQIHVSAKLGDGLQSIREEAERKLIRKVLLENNYNIYKSAKIIGIRRENLYYFIKKFGWKIMRNAV
ncbi:response regulator [Candidatus Magnetominusculus dajiuhuensis]|uniref:response regulator n=1 Tax=Candidatus Magnetominusculus dajiuhuensis TaxID=3137712 RepID=UPI003B42F055